MKTLPLLLAAASIGLALGPARAEQRSYELAGFDTVSVATGISAIVEIGGGQSVSAEAPNAAALDRLKVEVTNGRLELAIDGNFVNWFFNFGQRKPIVVHIATPSLKAAEASSGADLDITGIAAAGLSLTVSSGASVAATATGAERLAFDASTGGTIKAAGTCTHLIANASTGASLDARDLICADVNAQASAGGHADVHADKSINANASVGGGIRVFGNPTDVNSNSGTGGSVDFSR
ncbi:MAG: DUF2807 domain-containing protein [Devosia sp.]|nr:DUF2807 domain-containing protein [Devosia sp.]